MVFPHPFQMAMMGGILSDAQHEEREQKLESYAGSLEQQIDEYDSAYRNLQQSYSALAEHARSLEEERNEWIKQFRNAGEMMKKMLSEAELVQVELERFRSRTRDAAKEYETLRKAYQRLKRTVVAIFDTHGDKVLRPEFSKHRERILEIVKSLP